MITKIKNQPAPDSGTHPENTHTGKKPGIVKHLNIIIPSIVVLICAVAMCFMLFAETERAGAIYGKFVCNSSHKTDAYIVFDRDGSYSFYESEGAVPMNGTWDAATGKLVLTENTSGNSDIMYFVDGKYLAFDDENFLMGSVPDDSKFNADFTAEDGTVYTFESDGKCYTSEDGRNTELGRYITDGKFIVITIENTAHTYLNCGDGITPVYFTRS